MLPVCTVCRLTEQLRLPSCCIVSYHPLGCLHYKRHCRTLPRVGVCVWCVRLCRKEMISCFIAWVPPLQTPLQDTAKGGACLMALSCVSSVRPCWELTDAACTKSMSCILQHRMLSQLSNYLSVSSRTHLPSDARTIKNGNQGAS